VKASLFITCVNDVFYPRVGKAMVQVLRKCGVQLDFPEGQVCCGQPSYNSGYHEETRQAAKQIISAFANSEYVVGASGSCVGMIKQHYPELFQDEPDWEDRARELSQKIYEFSQFLVEVLRVEDVGAVLNATATYHQSCHMTRILKETETPKRLLEKVQGLEMVELPLGTDCCGFGGTFSVKMAHISEAMVQEKTEHIMETKARVLIGADMACLMNISGRLRRNGQKLRVMHIAEVLAEGSAG